MNNYDKHLREYFRSLKSSEPQTPYFLKDLFIFLFLMFFVVWFIPSTQAVLSIMVIILMLMIFRRISKQKKEFVQLKKACFQKIAVEEYKKRLERISPEMLLKILKEEVSKKFPVSNLQINNGLLEGYLWGEKIAVAYLDVHGEEFVTKREVLTIIRKCIQQGFSQVRIFTNGEFGSDLPDFVQRFNLNIRLYNEEKLRYLLKNTPIFPSVTEIKNIIDHEIGKRQKKLTLLRKEILKKKKYTVYLFYGFFLLFLAWLGLGEVFLNLLACLILLGLALMNIIRSFRAEDKEVAPEVYFQREGF